MLKFWGVPVLFEYLMYLLDIEKKTNFVNTYNGNLFTL
jgi:hypothetical protein